MRKDGTCVVSDPITRDMPVPQNSHIQRWMAPESLQQNIYSRKTDVFSYGVVLYEIATQGDPWSEVSLPVAVQNVIQGKRMEIPSGSFLMPFMSMCWHQNPAERPTFSDILYDSELNIMKSPELFTPFDIDYRDLKVQTEIGKGYIQCLIYNYMKVVWICVQINLEGSSCCSETYFFNKRSFCNCKV